MSSYRKLTAEAAGKNGKIYPTIQSSKWIFSSLGLVITVQDASHSISSTLGCSRVNVGPGDVVLTRQTLGSSTLGGVLWQHFES